MGSGDLEKANTKNMAEVKKSLYGALKKIFHWPKKTKKRDQNEAASPKNEEPKVIQPLKVTPVVALLERHDKEAQQSKDEDDELNNFKWEELEDEPVTNHSDAQVPAEISVVSDEDKYVDDTTKSQDSGEITVDDVGKGLENLKLTSKEKKKKTVYVRRGPIRGQRNDRTSHPYDPNNTLWEGRVNLAMSSGGWTSCRPTEHCALSPDINDLIPNNEQETFSVDDIEQMSPEEVVQIAQQCVEKCKDLILGLPQHNVAPEPTFENTSTITSTCHVMSPEGMWENGTRFELNGVVSGLDDALLDDTWINGARDYNTEVLVPTQDLVLTPPYSYSYPSPPSDSYPSPPSDRSSSCWNNPTDVQSPKSGITYDNLSPGNFSLNDYSYLENFQNLPQESDNPEAVEAPAKETKIKKTVFKKMNNQLTEEFAKKNCCQRTRKSCVDIFKGIMDVLSIEMRNKICTDVAQMDLGKVDVLLLSIFYHIATNRHDDKYNVEYKIAWFSVICDRVLLEKPDLFLGDMGLTLLLASIECKDTPILTRYLVQCVRLAHQIKFGQPGRNDPHKPIFYGIKATDNPVHECVQKGDEYSDVLYELVWTDDNELPLFDVEQTNSDGLPPLHAGVARRAAGGAGGALLAHVLLRHGGASLETYDVKGGDTAIHLAVNSPRCDIRFMLALFNHIDYKKWPSCIKDLKNRSSQSVLAFYRSAHRSRGSTEYPFEVKEFIEKFAR